MLVCKYAQQCHKFWLLSRQMLTLWGEPERVKLLARICNVTESTSDGEKVMVTTQWQAIDV